MLIQGEQLRETVHILFLVFHEQHRQLYQQVGKGDQHDSGKQVKSRLEDGDYIAVYSHSPKSVAENIQRLHNAQNKHKSYSADTVKHHMYHTGTLGIPAFTTQEAIEGGN